MRPEEAKMRSVIARLAFGVVFAVVGLNSQLVSQRVDSLGQLATAGPHLPVVPMTVK